MKKFTKKNDVNDASFVVVNLCTFNMFVCQFDWFVQEEINESRLNILSAFFLLENVSVHTRFLF